MSPETILLTGLVIALAFAVVRWLKACQEASTWPLLNQPMANVSYEFSKSWASTITATGGVLGSLISASLVTDAAQKLGFVSLNLICVVLVAAAPLVYMAFRASVREDRGSKGALLLACSLTIWAATAQLAGFVALITSLAGSTQIVPIIWLYVIFVATWVVIVIYAWRSLGALLVPPLVLDKGLKAQDVSARSWSLL